MAKVYSIGGIVPVIDPTAYVHPDAVLIGDVIVGPRCYVGPSASLRGDFGRLILKEGTNVQDACVMHGFPGSETVIEEDGHIGHGAVLHGCRIGRNVLVGMNSVVMDNVEIGENSIVAAMAFIKANTAIPPRSLVAGIPARIVRAVSDEELSWKSKGTAAYQALAQRCLRDLHPAEPLSTMEPDRKRIEKSDVEPLYAARMRLDDAAS